MAWIEYPEEAIGYLCQQDEALKLAIERIGPIRRERADDVFSALIHSFVAQQISTKAAQAVWDRLVDATGIDAQALVKMDEDSLRALGLSMRKAQYVRGAAQAVMDGTLDIQALHEMSDEQIRESLCALYGVGIWTAEMLMIFSLGRLDVLCERDAGIIRGMKRVYQTDMLTASFINSVKSRVSPFGTVASLYFWAVASET